MLIEDWVVRLLLLRVSELATGFGRLVEQGTDAIRDSIGRGSLTKVNFFLNLFVFLVASLTLIFSVFFGLGWTTIASFASELTLSNINSVMVERRHVITHLIIRRVVRPTESELIFNAGMLPQVRTVIIR